MISKLICWIELFCIWWLLLVSLHCVNMYLFFFDSVCDIRSYIQISRLWTLTKVAVVWCWYWCLWSSIECNSFINLDNVYILRSWHSTLNWLNECGKDWRIMSTWDSRALLFVMFFVPPLFLWPLFMLAMGVILSLFLTRNWNWSWDSWSLIEIKMLLRSLEFLLGLISFQGATLLYGGDSFF